MPTKFGRRKMHKELFGTNFNVYSKVSVMNGKPILFKMIMYLFGLIDSKSVGLWDKSVFQENELVFNFYVTDDNYVLPANIQIFLGTSDVNEIAEMMNAVTMSQYLEKIHDAIKVRVFCDDSTAILESLLRAFDKFAGTFIIGALDDDSIGIACDDNATWLFLPNKLAEKIAIRCKSVEIDGNVLEKEIKKIIKEEREKENEVKKD